VSATADDNRFLSPEVSIRKADHHRLELCASPPPPVAGLRFQSARRIIIGWRSRFLRPTRAGRSFQSARRIIIGWSAARWVCCSSVRRFQSARRIIIGWSSCSSLVLICPWRCFNPQGGSSSVGASIFSRPFARGCASFNPQGGSSSVGAPTLTRFKVPL